MSSDYAVNIQPGHIARHASKHQSSRAQGCHGQDRNEATPIFAIAIDGLRIGPFRYGERHGAGASAVDD